MDIRPLTEADVKLFRELRLRALREEPAAFTASAEEFEQQSPEAVAQRLINTPENFVLGAFVDGKLTGLVGFHRETSTKLHHVGVIWGMYVALEARNQGIGRTLIREVIQRARSLSGLDHILLSVAESQTTARTLYESSGFVVYGREPRAVKIRDQYLDEELMTLDLRRQAA
jgi:ribosomal protein S18 acetylase RimI-like enzyme